MDVEVEGDNQVAIGGEGGEAPQWDGRGGRGGPTGLFRVGWEDFPLPDKWMPSDAGRGGDGAHSIQYQARLLVLERLLAVRARTRDEEAALALVVDERQEDLNVRLASMGHVWRVGIEAAAVTFYDV